MTSSVRHGDDELAFLGKLKQTYERQGFSVIIHPGPDALPGFLGSYSPDAIAVKGNEKVAIEVKSRRTSAADRRVAEIRSKFNGHPDWRLDVAYALDEEPQPTTIPAADLPSVRRQLEEIALLKGLGHCRAAFVLAWSALEAALHAHGGTASPPRAPGAVIQWLAMNGYVDPATERRLRSLTELRNRIIHGDLTADASMRDVDMVVAAVEETLAAGAA